MFWKKILQKYKKKLVKMTLKNEKYLMSFKGSTVSYILASTIIYKKKILKKELKMTLKNEKKNPSTWRVKAETDYSGVL